MVKQNYVPKQDEQLYTQKIMQSYKLSCERSVTLPKNQKSQILLLHKFSNLTADITEKLIYLIK